MTSPATQSQYQVRFDWGVEGARDIGEGVDVIVWVDVLGSSAPGKHAAPVVAGSLRNRRAVADWALARQGEKGDRFVIAIVAAGPRFAVEDLLGAGAVIDALADVGIDFCSPEAAAASAAYTGLRNATGHLISASVAGKTAAADGRRSEVNDAIVIDASAEVLLIGE